LAVDVVDNYRHFFARLKMMAPANIAPNINVIRTFTEGSVEDATSQFDRRVWDIRSWSLL